MAGAASKVKKVPPPFSFFLFSQVWALFGGGLTAVLCWEVAVVASSGFLLPQHLIKVSSRRRFLFWPFDCFLGWKKRRRLSPRGVDTGGDFLEKDI